MLPLLSLLCVLNSQPLSVVVDHVSAGRGKVVVAIFCCDQDFFKKPIASQKLSADGTSMEFTFSLPPGEYAVATYQDLNDNGELDKNFFSIPREPYGFSNNFRPHFSAPTFGDCKFRFSQTSTIQIHLK